MRSKELSASDEADRDLLHHLIDLLHQREYELHRSLIISVNCGVVEVRGGVMSYHLRQIAAEYIKRIVGVNCVADQIVVDRTI